MVPDLESLPSEQAAAPPGMVGRACRFRTIDEFWYILAGEGEVWRRAPDGRESLNAVALV